MGCGRTGNIPITGRTGARSWLRVGMGWHKAAREFHKRWAEAKDDTSKEEAQASYRKWKAYFEKQERLHPSSP